MDKYTKAKNVNYDANGDSLYIYNPNSEKTGKRVLEFLSPGFIVDISEKKEIIGIEMFSAAEKFQIPKEKLEKIKDGSFCFNINEEKIQVVVELIFGPGDEKKITFETNNSKWGPQIPV